MAHPSITGILRYFDYAHLPPGLREISEGFHYVAHNLVDDPLTDGPELAVALRKLLESKDAAVRSALDV